MTDATMPKPPERLNADLDQYFADIGLGVNPYLMAQERRLELAQMNAKSDIVLLKQGVTRGDIPRRIFRDLFRR